MTRTARVEPIQEEREESILITGWRVVDVTDQHNYIEISRHEGEPEAIQAARNYERDTSNEPGSEPDDTQDYDSLE